MSEKSARVAEEGNQFVFRVRKDATRTHVKQAVELMFDVKVQSVQVLNQPGKKRRFGAIKGQRSGYKKAERAPDRGPHDYLRVEGLKSRGS